MTEENQTCECKDTCCCCEKVKEFLFRAIAVFVGVTLAILLCSAILKPKMPPMPQMGGQMPPNMERQMSQPPMAQQPGEFRQQRMGHNFQGKEFKGRPQPFQEQGPQNMPMPERK